jgi:hypothetical protein
MMRKAEIVAVLNKAEERGLVRWQHGSMGSYLVTPRHPMLSERRLTGAAAKNYCEGLLAAMGESDAR